MWRVCILVCAGIALVLGASERLATFDEVRAPVRAEQAVLCWSPELTSLVNTTILTVAPPSDTGEVTDEELGLFFAILYAKLSALQPLCPAYAATTVSLARRWRESVTQRPASQTEYTAHCKRWLGLESAHDVPLTHDDPLLACMRAGTFRVMALLPSMVQ